VGREVAFLWKRRPSGKGLLFLWGFVLVILALLPPLLLTSLVSLLPPVIALVLTIPLLKGSFSLRGLLRAGEEVAAALLIRDLAEARRLTSWHLVSRDTSRLTESEIVGCVAESLAENLTDSVISPLFWFTAAGLPGAWFSRTVNTCDSMIAYREGDYEWGGKFAARLDDLVQWVPARLTAVCLCLAAGLYRRSSGPSAWKALASERKKTASPNAGWTMSAVAGALGLRLEKEGHYLLNESRRSPSPDDLTPLFGLIKRAAFLGILLPLALFGGMLWLM